MTNNQHKRGFTLLETLVAITILMTAIAGPLTIAFKAFSAATVAKDQVTAFYLAQDALEYIRFARDTNRLAGRPWLGDISSAATNLNTCTGADGCYFDSTLVSPADTLTACAGACPQIRYDSLSGTYQYDPSDPITMFTRTVKITVNGVNSNEVLASSTVTWLGSGGIQRSVTLFEILTNWP